MHADQYLVPGNGVASTSSSRTNGASWLIVVRPASGSLTRNASKKFRGVARHASSGRLPLASSLSDCSIRRASSSVLGTPPIQNEWYCGTRAGAAKLSVGAPTMRSSAAEMLMKGFIMGSLPVAPPRMGRTLLKVLWSLCVCSDLSARERHLS